MKHRNGFTVVELVITITIMAILMTVGVVALRSTQVNGRDEKRKSDVANIVLGLQSFYQETRPDYGFYGEGNSYPNTAAIATESTLRDLVPDINASSLRAPGVAPSDPISLIAATNAVETTAGVLPQPTINTYVYQPLASLATKGPLLMNCFAINPGSNEHGCMLCDGSLAYGSVVTMNPDGSSSVPFTPNPTTKQPCYRFNLFYRLEGDNTVYKMMSKDQ